MLIDVGPKIQPKSAKIQPKSATTKVWVYPTCETCSSTYLSPWRQGD